MGDLDQTTHQEITKLLDGISAEQSEQHLADMVGADWLLARFELAGRTNDPDAAILADPAAAMTSYHVPTDTTGGTRGLSDAEVDRLLEVAHVEKTLPSELARVAAA